MVAELGLIPAIRMSVATAPHATHRGDTLDHGWLAVPAPLPTPRGCLPGGAGLPIARLSRVPRGPRPAGPGVGRAGGSGGPRWGQRGVRQLGGPEGTGPPGGTPLGTRAAAGLSQERREGVKADAMLFSLPSSPSLRAQDEPRCELREKGVGSWPPVLAHSS